jgi:histidine ammonia-lyase
MMTDPRTVEKVVLDGKSLTLEGFIAVARYGARVEISAEAMCAVAASRALAEKIAEQNRVAYGITTGFGDFATVAVPESVSSTLSTNLILSHCTATGEPYSAEQARGMMLLRANALCRGVSGVRPVLIEMLAGMLNRGVIPSIP